jgi:hypothetical protein
VKEFEGGTVRLRDIGNEQLGAENERTILKRNGIPMVGVVLIAQPGANNIAIADEFYKRLENSKLLSLPILKQVSDLMLQCISGKLFLKLNRLYSLPSHSLYLLYFYFFGTGVQLLFRL